MLTLRKTPLVRVVVPFICGLLLQIIGGFPVLLYVTLIGIGFVATSLLFVFSQFIQHRFRYFSGLSMAILFAGLGALFVWLLKMDEQRVTSLAQQKSQVHCVRVTAPPISKKKSYQLEVKLIENQLNKGVELKALLYLPKSDSLKIESLRIGDLVYVKARFQLPETPKNPLQFNYRRYLMFQRVYLQAYVSPPNLLRIESQHQFSLVQQAFELRTSLVNKMKAAGLSGNELAIAGALIIGEERDLTPALKSAYSASGAMHVLSVSGLHIGIVFLLLKLLFTPLLKRARLRKWIVLLMIAVLWGYSFVTGLSPSVQRAAMMFSFIALGDVLNRRGNIYNMLAASALFLLLIEPYLIMDVGFQLSYLALLGILIIHPLVFKLIFVKNKGLRKVWEITSVSLAAQLTTGFLSVYYFHQFPSFFLLSNLVVIPVSFVILVLGFVFILTCWIPGVAAFVGFALKFTVWGLNESLFWLEKQPGATWDNLFLSAVNTWFCYVFLGIMLLIIVLRHKLSLWMLGGFTGLWLLVSGYQQIIAVESPLTIYSVPNALVVGVQHESGSRLICEPKQPAQLDFFLGNELARLGIRNSLSPTTNHELLGILILPDSNLILIGEKEKVLVVRKPPVPEIYPNIKFSYLLLENSLFNWSHLLQIRFNQLIVGNTIPLKNRRKLLRFCQRKKLPTTELATRGYVQVW